MSQLSHRALNGTGGNITFSIDTFEEDEIKVYVDGVEKTNGGSNLHDYTIPDYATTGGTVTWNTSGSNTAPSNAFKIRIVRETDVLNQGNTAVEGRATFAAGSSIKFADLNNNTKQVLRSLQEHNDQKIQRYDIEDGEVIRVALAADVVDGTKIADDSINSEHYVNGSIDKEHLAADLIDGTKIADQVVDTEHLADNAVGILALAPGAVTTAKLVDSNVTTNKLNNLAVTTAKIADSAITNVKLQDGAVSTAKIQNGNITTDKLGDQSVTANKIADGNISTVKIADSQITSAKIADGTIVAGDLASNAVTTVKITDANVTTAKIADSNVTTAKIADEAVGHAKLANDSVQAAKIASNAVTTIKILDANVTQSKIADGAVTAAKIASNAVTTDKIQDGELTTLAGMQSTTASNLASATALTASTAELNQLDGITLETSVTTSSDTRIPTSKAVNDLVLSVTNALGGFVAIDNETSFPTANPDPSNGAGTVVSISQLASGLAVNGSGVATISNGAGSGNTVTITGFPTSLVSQTLPATSGLQVQTTSTLHTYTFHKQLASAADIQAISATVNSFSNRYRVSASAPTSSLDGGDLWYDTTNSKLMVYSSQNSAWEESSAIGNFFICTLSSSSSTGGGSATANGTAYRFTISNAPQSAQALIVSVDGVVQKPNSGSSQPSEGFVLVSNDIIFGAAPANGASIFVTAIGSTVGIGTPSDNTVTTAILQNGSVTTAKIVDANVTTAKITDANVTTAKIADDAVNAAKLASNAVVTASIVDANVTTAKIADSAITDAKIAGNTITAGSIANNAISNDELADNAVDTAAIADDAVTAAKLANTSVTAASYGSSTSIPSITVDAQGRITAASGNTVNTDLVGDSSPQLGGDLDINSRSINFGDSSGGSNNRLNFGAGLDMNIYHDASAGNVIKNGATTFSIINYGENMLKAIPNGAVELYHDNVKTLYTNTTGASVKGGTTGSASELKVYGNENQDAILMLAADEGDDNADYWRVLADASGDDLYIQNYTDGGWETNIRANGGGQVELYHDNSKKFETGVSGDYGSVTVSNGKNSWSGYSINGHWNFMGDSGSTGLYNDMDNEWFLYAGRNGSLSLYYDGSNKLETTSVGIEVHGSTDNARIDFGDAYANSRIGYFGLNRFGIDAHRGIQIRDPNASYAVRFTIDANGHAQPGANNTYDLGTSSYRWRNVYTNDLHLSNEGHSNEVDGTWGNWTIQEGESDLFLKNNRSGKKYKFNLTEVS